MCNVVDQVVAILFAPNSRAQKVCLDVGLRVLSENRDEFSKVRNCLATHLAKNKYQQWNKGNKEVHLVLIFGGDIAVAD
jgi:hypothetical protein